MLYELAKGEPEQTLRTEVLETLEVRRADIRPPLAWLRSRDAMSLTLLTDEQGPLGALVLPAGTRVHALTLEEVRALRTLADRLAALLGVSSALAVRAPAKRPHEPSPTATKSRCELEHQLSAGIRTS